MKERDRFVDIAKGLGILLIVCIHTEVFDVIGMPLVFIAVPVFFYMSGFYDHSERAFSQWLPKSFRTLIIPAVIWVLIGTAYIKFLGYLKDRSWGENPFSLYGFGSGNGPAWFLFALFYAKIILGSIEHLKLPKVIYGGAILGIGYIGMYVNLPLFIDEGFLALPLYAAGKNIFPSVKGLFVNKWILLAGVFAFVVYLLHWCAFVIVPGRSHFEPDYFVSFVVILLVFFPYLWISQKLEKITMLSDLGKRSLGIMLLHSPMCHTAAVILNRMFEKGSLMWILSFLPIYFVIVALSYWLTCLIERYCPIMLGKKVKNNV